MKLLPRRETQYQRCLPPSEFWMALKQVRNYLFEDELRDYYEGPFECRQGHVFESLAILDCWLDKAIEEGWLGEGDQ